MVQVKVTRTDDCMEHGNFKYIKKVPNGKGGYTYYYDKEQATKDANKLINESSRKVDNLKYDAKYELIKKQNSAKLRKVDKTTVKDNALLKQAKRISAIAPNMIKAGHNRIMKMLNNVGDGKLDNTISKKVKEIKKKYK